MKSSDKYKPISCVFYDYIEHYALRKEQVEIAIRDGENERLLKTKILDTKSENKVEYILVENEKEWIRMDLILRINEHKLSDFNRC